MSVCTKMFEAARPMTKIMKLCHFMNGGETKTLPVAALCNQQESIYKVALKSPTITASRIKRAQYVKCKYYCKATRRESSESRALLIKFCLHSLKLGIEFVEFGDCRL
jgi:hypothetical protein